MLTSFCDQLRGRLQLCPYEESVKFYYLRTHCATHFFVYYAVIASCKALIACILPKEKLFICLPMKNDEGN